MTKFNSQNFIKIFLSSSLIYTSALVRYLNATSQISGYNDISLSSKLLFPVDSSDLLISKLKAALINESIHLLGPLKLVDSLFKFESIHCKALTSAFFGALLDVFSTYAINFDDYCSKYQIAPRTDVALLTNSVSLLCRIVGSALLTYVDCCYSDENLNNISIDGTSCNVNQLTLENN